MMGLAVARSNGARENSAEMCKAFPPLGAAMSKVQMIVASKGIDQPAFSSERDDVLQLFDGWCDTPANVGLDTLQDLMSHMTFGLRRLRLSAVGRHWDPSPVIPRRADLGDTRSNSICPIMSEGYDARHRKPRA
jgi:hypothetical protein